MRKLNKLCRSVLSGTLAMAIVSANAILPAVAHGATAEEPDIAVTSDLAGAAAEGFENEGSIVYAVEEITAVESVVLSTTYTEPVLTTTTTAVVKPFRASMAEENGYRYYITGGNAVIDSYIGEDAEVEVPDSLGGLSVTEIGYAAFSGNMNITSVRIPETVKRINHDAFSGCTALGSVELPDGIISIQDGAFAGCESLKEIILPESISRIEDNTFSGCQSLTDITLNTNTDYIGKSAFANCTSLSSFSIPESVTAIGNMAFAGSGLVNIDVPDTVTSLGYSVFADCRSLEEISLPDGITNLKSGNSKGMFSGCSALTKVAFPEELNEIGDIAFADCSSLESIAIPETVNTIGTELFKNCEKLENVEIPESVTRIEDGMFSGCVSLPSIRLHDGIEYIGNSAFEDCMSLDNVTIPGNVSVIGDACFINCESLTEIDIPASVTTLGRAALAGCSALEKATLPDSIEELGSFREVGLFTNDIVLKDVNLPASLKTIGGYTFKNCLSLEKIELPKNVSVIGGYAFESCISLKEISLPESVVTLYDKTFSGCSSLSSVILPKNFDEAKNYAFENCTSLTDLGQKSGFFKFAEDTFSGCSSLSDERATVFTNDTPVVNVSSAASIVGGIANFSIKYDLNDWISSDLVNNGNVSFEVPMPAGLSLIESSVISDSDDNKVTYAGSNSYISLSKPEGTLRFSARIEAYNENDYIVAPRIHFYSHKYNWTQRIPVMALTVPKITISAQSTVSSLECDVFGIAQPGRKVKIYVDGELAASVTSNQYTGKYVATVSLPEKKDSEQYNISAVCGVDKTDEISVVYSDAKPSIKKVELIYCTHAPSDINDYMETLDITGVFTRGEHPVIQYYPKGNMRFRITADNSEKIGRIAVRSRKGTESKHLIAEYDEKEGVWITPEDMYFDESNHNYAPGSLNFIIFEKTEEIIDDEYVDEMMEKWDLKYSECEYTQIGEQSFVAGLKNEKGDSLTDCYFCHADSVDISGVEITADRIALIPEKYGFKKTDKAAVHDGVIYFMYLKTTRYNSSLESKSTLSDKFDKSVLDMTDKAYKEAGLEGYDMEDYLVFSQLMVAEGGSGDAYINIMADAEEYVPFTWSYIGHVFPSSYRIVELYVRNNMPGSILLAADEEEGKNSDDEYQENLDKAKKELDDIASDNLPKDSNSSKFYNLISDLYDMYRTNEDATEQYEKDISKPTATEDGAKDQERIANAKRSKKVGITFFQKVLRKTPLKKYYSDMLDNVNEGTDDVLDLNAERFRDMDILDRYGHDEDFQLEFNDYGNLSTIMDPSGIVYEGIKSKTVSGAVVTCYMFNEDTGEWEVWNAEDYDQVNPLITDEAGSYAWDVPEGRYYVTCEKEGYDLIKSEEFAVAPPKFDLDFNLLNETSPVVNGYTLGENTIVLDFTKVMDIDTVNNDSVSVSGVSGDITIEPQLYAEGDKFTDKFIISGDFSKATALKLSVNSKASDYTGAAVAEYSADIDNIYADLILDQESVELIAEDTYQITANKESVYCTSEDPEIAAVDENGLVTAVSAGSTKITAVDSTGKEAVLTVAVEAKIVVDEATAEKLEKQSLKDYKKRTGVTAAEAECKIVDNKCIVEIRDEDGNILDIYTLDPETGVGTDSNGETVDLPQTGNNSVNNVLWVIAAIALMCSGVFIIRRSGVISRKRS